MKNIHWVLMLLFLCFDAAAVADLYEFDDPVDKTRYQHFVDVLRCPTCQNQNLAGSDSLVASDLRREVYEQIIAGRSDTEITGYMVARYGEHILYKPPLTATTAVLWFGPVGLFVMGLLIFIGYVRRRRGAASTAPAALSTDEANKLQEILGQQESQS